MNKDKLLVFTIVLLSLSVIFGSYVLANAISELGRGFAIETSDIGSPIESVASEIAEFGRVYDKIHSEALQEKQTMYMSEAAEYLGFSFEELKFLIEEKNLNIPYIKVNHKYVFYKDALDQWKKNIEQQEYIFE